MPRQVKMFKDMRGSQDGKTVSTFERGKVYLLSDRLAQNFLEQQSGVCEVMTEPVEEPAAPKTEKQPPQGTSMAKLDTGRPKGEGAAEDDGTDAE